MNSIGPDNSKESISVVLIDDQEVLRAGIKLFLQPAGLIVVGESSQGENAREMVKQTRPDVVVVDASLPDVRGVDLVKQLSTLRAPVIVYSGTADTRLVYMAIGAGAKGFALKDDPPETLIDAIRAAAAGDTWLAPRARDEFVDGPAAMARMHFLSPREREILGLISRGYSTDNIADHLTLSSHTVRTHVKNAMRKLDATTRAHAIAIAMRDLSIS